MFCAKLRRLGVSGGLIFSAALLLCGGAMEALAQEPPIAVPVGGPPVAGPNALPLESWLLYPSLDTFTQYSNNYFLSPVGKVSGWSFGETPSLTAEWSNGIHTTTLYGEYTHIEYPTDNAIITNDGEATFTQKYAPLRDLDFTFLADYTHHTIANALTNAIPSPIASNATTVLPNGDTVLPNGTIVSPSGQVVGQAGPTVNVAGLSVVNPYDAYTVTGEVKKLFADGVVTLGASVLRQNYEEQATKGRDVTAKTLTEDASFWLGPILYLYSSGAFTQNDNTSPVPDLDAYRVIGGLGTRQVGLFRGSAYFGHQGSQSIGSPAAGGNVYGGSVTYYPTPIWTIGGNLDVTINLAPSGALSSTQALTTPANSPVQVALSTSSHITTTSIQSEYKITPLWTANALISYSNVEYLGTPMWENVWAAVGTLRYRIRRDFVLTWQYQYASIVSNLPFTNANRNFISMSASYKF